MLKRQTAEAVTTAVVYEHAQDDMTGLKKKKTNEQALSKAKSQRSHIGISLSYIEWPKA